MKKTLLIMNLIAGGMVLVFSVLALFMPFGFVGSTEQDITDARYGWYYVDASGNVTAKEADLHELEFNDDGTVTVSRTIVAGGLAGGDLCFISTNITFKVYMNGKLIYDFTPDLKRYMGASYGNLAHEVNMPYFDGDAEIRITAEKMGKDMWFGFENAVFQNSAAYFKAFIKENLWKLVFSFVTFLIGLFLVVLALFFEFRTRNKIEAVSIGVIAIILAVWSNSGTYMLETFSSDLGMVRMVNYGSLILLPLPGISLVLCVTRELESKTLKLIEILVGLNLLTHITVIGFRLADYHDILLFTHFNFILAAVLGIFHVVRAFMRHRIDESNQIVVLGTFGVVMFAGIVDLISYYIGGGMDMARFTRIGLLIFIGVLTIYEVGQLVEISRKSFEADMMKRLAHQDGLTGLENRLSFNEFEAELKEKKEGFCILVQLDINDLKKMNDNYGHVEGDRGIRAAAAVISESFKEPSRVFRTGGDEFIAVMKGTDRKKLLKEYENNEKKLQQAIETYNENEQPPVPLSLAYGMAECDCTADDPEEKGKLADERMYAHKKLLKKGRE